MIKDHEFQENLIKLQAFFDQTPDAVFIEDEEDNIIEVNPAACELLGYDRETLLHMKVADLRAPEFISQPQNIIKTELAKASPFEGLNRHRDGRKIPVEVRTGKLVGLKGNLVLSIVRDISERKQLTQTLERKVAERMNELAALHGVVTAMSESSEIKSVAETALDRILSVVYGQVGLIQLWDETLQGDSPVALKGVSPNQARRLENFLAETGLANDARLGVAVRKIDPGMLPGKLSLAGINTCIGVPLRSRGKPLGLLVIFKEMAQQQLTHEEISLLNALADQVGVAVEIIQLRQTVKNVAVQQERHRLAQYLHDSVTQSLYSLIFIAEGWRRMINHNNLESIATWPDIIEDATRQITLEVRLLLYELTPWNMDNMSLSQSLQKRLGIVENHTGLKVNLFVQDERNLQKQAKEELYYIAQEALNNVLKHAKATMVDITLDFSDDQVSLSITDDGQGFDSQTLQACGMGISNMRERSQNLDGQFRIHSACNKGTCIEIVVPAQEAYGKTHSHINR